jgi:hypothetical protein
VRLILPGLIAIILIGNGASASAGPTCEDRAGEAVRCEDARAMPPGWTLSLDDRLKQSASEPPDPTPAQLGGVFVLIFLFFALIALMPDFDGWSAGKANKSLDDE